MGAAASIGGSVSKAEAQEIAGSKWDEKRYELYANGDDKITADEWADLVDISSKFDHYDTDRNGFITPLELSKLLKDCGFADEDTLANHMAELMVHKVDMNKDGQLDFGEFIRIYRGLGNNYQAGLKKIHTTEGKVRRATIKAAPAAAVSKSAETANATAESEENANATAESEENAIKKIQSLLEKVKQLQTENTSFKEEISALQTENATFKEEISALQTENTSFKEEITALQTENNALKSKIPSSKAEEEQNKVLTTDRGVADKKVLAAEDSQPKESAPDNAEEEYHFDTDHDESSWEDDH